MRENFKKDLQSKYVTKKKKKIYILITQKLIKISSLFSIKIKSNYKFKKQMMSNNNKENKIIQLHCLEKKN